MARRTGAIHRAFAIALTCVLVAGGCTSAEQGQRSTAEPGAVPPGLSAAPTATSTSTLPTATSEVGSAPPPAWASPTTTTHPSATVPDPYALRTEHDAQFAVLMKGLTAALMSGDKTKFLAPFAAPLGRRVGRWVTNTRKLGVSAALFARADDYSSGASDSSNSFTRTVVLGVRTPYDDSDSMAGIPYAVGVSISGKRGRTVLTISFWQPKYLDDPMNCDCNLSVVHGATTAVVANSTDDDLVFWLPAALEVADSGISWARAQLPGSGLVAPRGTVVFLADKPFHWFLSSTGPGQRSNVTAGLLDARGPYPGSVYSDQSRIVLMLQAADGSVVPNDSPGRQYAQDVLTHESTHQLMNRNSTLPERTENSPPSWVVEGIAVAVETLHRDSLGDSDDSGYPDPNDPKNIDPGWFAEHLTDQMPTKTQLGSAPHSGGSGYYAIAGSVFRYIAREYGYTEMLKVAKAMYSRPAQNPFAYFPDPEKRGALLPAATAKSRWKDWFVNTYE
jgi:hypothetical protein